MKLPEIHRSFNVLVIALIIFGCQPGDYIQPRILTENVIILVMDGARYSETWGDSTHALIPHLSEELAPNGVVSTNFYNIGPTLTVPGHTALTTGVYQTINNSGMELPQNPSIFQYFLREHAVDSTKAWIISSKDKLAVLSNCGDPLWQDTFRPSFDCGKNGLGSGYRPDSVTMSVLLKTLDEHQPNLVLINFREPDFSAHQNNWEGYKKGIKDVDGLIGNLWDYLQSTPPYKDRTTLFVTNDHGRHLDDVQSGFVSHGDGCEGCRHINLIAIGPDFKDNYKSNIPRTLTDIYATAAKLLDLKIPEDRGSVMSEVFD